MIRKGIKLVSMRDALSDPDYFGDVLAGETWAAWRVVLIAAEGEPLTDDERVIYRELTGRDREPDEPCDELWGVVGRRGGKTRAFAVYASYLAACYDYSALQAPGERLKLPLLAQTRRTARKAFGYIEGVFTESKSLRELLVNKSKSNDEIRYDITTEVIRLSVGIDIEVMAANFRTVRGETLIAVLCDEVAFWFIEGSANPDEEIIDAARNGLGTTGGPVCVLSSPYARRGALYETHARHYGPSGDPTTIVLQAPTRRMNPEMDERIIRKAYDKDPAKAAAEYGAEFRRDVEAFVTLEAVQACTPSAIRERPPSKGLRYVAFVDCSGGGADAMTLAIAHREGEVGMLDAVREVQAGTSPDSVVEEFATLLKSYGVSKVTGDAYAGEWPRERFRVRGIAYEKSELHKSDLYLEFLPILNSCRTSLLNVPKLEKQLVSLERKTSRGTGKDTIDHPSGKNYHDDVANAVSGAVVSCLRGAQPLKVSREAVERTRNLTSTPRQDFIRSTRFSRNGNLFRQR